MIERAQITGLILAGGRGSRMGGVDKGLQTYRGLPLALHALLRLAPQVGHTMINANRNLGAYESFGVPVWPDASADYAGPLAGFVAGLERCETPWMITAPCDTPAFPEDLVARLAQAASAAQAEIALPETLEGGRMQAQPVFCLLQTSLLESLLRFVRDGGRKIDRWTEKHAQVRVRFDDAAAFFNINTLDELRVHGVGRA
jgi:molybdenum cofactor guanylyltransferase